jgi:alanyl-tRNA synthetase
MNDPTLMFANSGMVQFKNVFTGLEKRDYKRAVTAQKCIRAGGKHNDLENVGYTLRHHTFFEMLGNFSFGDYFKDEAIDYAWKFITKELSISTEKLYVTIYHDDEQAYNAWKKVSGFNDNKIIRISTNDNFWSMGDTGPCGPCSEIFYDHGENFKGKPPSEADETDDRFVEIWNLVFMQYEQVDKDTRIDLPSPSIDTGMGIERIAAVLQGTNDNYKIDSIQKLIDHSIDITKENNETLNSSHRVIADHLRSSCFLIADGVLPSNEGRGYVLRRIMRRAMRHVHLLGYKKELMHHLAPTLIAEMNNAYPELGRAEKLILDTLRYEEQRFKELLERGIKHLDNEVKNIKSGDIFPGESAFKLYDTYGFPVDLTQDILKTKQLEIDISGFEKKLNEQKESARKNWSGSGSNQTEKIWFTLSDKIQATEFIGYNNEESEAQVLGIISEGKQVEEIEANKECSVILNQTVFYAESGGQIGDTGSIYSDDCQFEVTDTQKRQSLIIHNGILKKGKMSTSLHVNLKINHEKRTSCKAYHSATHILHQALRDTLGEHVTQKGSLVSYDKLRFDFSHHKPMTSDEIENVENIANEVIKNSSDVETKLMNSEDAINSGALALFGEKYADEVRVLSIGLKEDKTYSTELCGGTHVNNTSEIGDFKIISESSVSSGIRRIEALRAKDLDNYKKNKLSEESELEEKKIESERLKEISVKNISEIKKQINDTVKQDNETHLIIKFYDDLKVSDLRNVVDYAKKTFKNEGVIVLGAKNNNKISYLVGVSDELSNNLGANDIAQFASSVSNGKGGGGRKDFAQSGGELINENKQIDQIKSFIISKL